MLRFKRLVLGAIAAMAIFGFAPSANAAFKVRISGTGLTTTTLSDPTHTEIAMSLSSLFPGEGFSGSPSAVSDPFFINTTPTSVTKIDIGGNVSYNGANGIPASIVFEVTRTDFEIASGDGILDTFFTAASISGSVTVKTQTWINYGPSGNNEFVTSPAGPGVGLAGPGGSFVTTLGEQSYVGPATNVNNPLALNGAIPEAYTGAGNPYSMTQKLVIEFGAAGGVISFDYSATVTTPVPAGMVLALSALPALGLGYFRRRKATKAEVVA